VKRIALFLSFIASISLNAHNNSSDTFYAQLQPTIQNSIWSPNNRLSNEEIQLLANTIYFSLMRAKVEQQIGQQLTVIAHKSVQLKMLDKEVIDLSVQFNEFELLSRSLKTNLALRTAIATVHEELMEQAMKNQRLFTLIDAMATHATEAITLTAQQVHGDAKQTLRAIQPVYDSVAQQFDIYGNTCEALAVNNYPFSVDEIMRNLALYNVIETMVDGLDSKIDEIQTTIQTLTQHISQLQDKGIELFALYYQTIYQGMIERSFDQNYFEIMASADLKESLMLNYLPEIA
jgi:hypothetical protein